MRRVPKRVQGVADSSPGRTISGGSYFCCITPDKRSVWDSVGFRGIMQTASLPWSGLPYQNIGLFWPD